MELYYHLEEQSGIIVFLNRFRKTEENVNSNIREIILNYLRSITYVSISAQIIIFPIIAYTNKTISISFILTNILTNYLISIIIILGFFLVFISFPFLSFAKFLGGLYKIPIDILSIITEYIAKIPISKIYIKAPYLWEIVLYYVLLFSIYFTYKKYRQAVVYP